MNPALLIRQARLAAGLSLRELAARAGTSHSAIAAYERGSRDPGVGTLERLLRATGHRLRLEITPIRGVDAERAGRLLEEVLDLADALPHRPAARKCPYPRFPT